MHLSLLRLLLRMAGPGDDFEPYGSATVTEILEKALNHVVVRQFFQQVNDVLGIDLLSTLTSKGER